MSSVTVSHAFVNPHGDGADPTKTQPSNWNAAHTVDTASLDAQVAALAARVTALEAEAPGATNVTKFYLHNATSTLTGTLPSGPLAGEIPDGSASGSGTPRKMNATIGVSQASSAISSNAAIGVGDYIMRIFVSGALAAQTISAQNITERWGLQQSNTDANLQVCGTLYLWRPSTGTAIGTIFFLQQGSSIGGTSEVDSSFLVTAANTTAQTALAGDILVFEMWTRVIQTIAASYTLTDYYDGTTDGSATTNAGYLLFTNAISVFDS